MGQTVSDVETIKKNLSETYRELNQSSKRADKEISVLTNILQDPDHGIQKTASALSLSANRIGELSNDLEDQTDSIVKQNDLLEKYIASLTTVLAESKDLFSEFSTNLKILKKDIESLPVLRGDLASEVSELKDFINQTEEYLGKSSEGFSKSMVELESLISQLKKHLADTKKQPDKPEKNGGKNPKKSSAQ